MTATYEQTSSFKDVGNYKYTRPRQPIAAMFSSPGPCYGLPGLVGQRNHDTRSVHVKYPAWNFGIRHGKFRDDCSPGPCYFPDTKIFRDGKDGTPHYSLYSRAADPNLFSAPGPGAYSPEATGAGGKRMPPAYSFGTRHKARRTDQTPAPNKYSLDSMLGTTIQSGKTQAPCISVRGRSKVGGFSEDLSKTPGPKYDVVNTGVYRNKPPQYSMTSRNAMPGDSTRKPGPGAHSPERGMLDRWNKMKDLFPERLHLKNNCEDICMRKTAETKSTFLSFFSLSVDFVTSVFQAWNLSLSVLYHCLKSSFFRKICF